MVKVATYVFFDLETTGLPHQERNKTKIIEVSFIAALREDIEKATIGSKPYHSKLTLMLNPQRKIHPDVVILTGISNDMVNNAPIFSDKLETILTFLNNLPKPVCLVAHNGNSFDYKIFLAELFDINASLPDDILCVDSLTGFRQLHKQKWPKASSETKENNFEDSIGSEDWPDLNVTPEDWSNIDMLCATLSDIKIYETSPKDLELESNKIVKYVDKNEKISFKLTDLYKRLLKKEIISSHRAEDDCIMLLECVVATKEFLVWADKYCKCISNIKPLQRY